MADSTASTPTPLEDLQVICDEIFERWDKDMRSGKLLTALAGHLPRYRADVTRVREALQTPLRLMLYCPKCGKQHVDAPHGEWTNPPHRSHLCHWCGCIWRPADFPTEGIVTVQTKGGADNWHATAFGKPAAEPQVLYLIWSNEHRAWWAPERRGYTRHVERAGRYSRAEAIAIAGVRGGGWPAEGNPFEIAIREADAVDQAAKPAAACAAGGVE